LHRVREDVHVAAVEEVQSLASRDELLVIRVAVRSEEQRRQRLHRPQHEGGDAILGGQIDDAVVGRDMHGDRRGGQRDLCRQRSRIRVPDHQRAVRRFEKRRSGEGKAARDGAVRLRQDRGRPARKIDQARSEEHTSELQSRENLVCRLLLEKKKKQKIMNKTYNKNNTYLVSIANKQCT